MELFFYRHLPTKHNIDGIFIGRNDLDCDRDYIIENTNAIKIDDCEYNKIYCSPLKRTRQTADLLFPDRQYIIDRRIIERDLGSWVNRSKRAIKEECPYAFFSNGNLDFSFTPPAGESFGSVLLRVSAFILDLYDNSEDNDRIAVITHNGIITAVKCFVNNDFSTENVEFQQFVKKYEVCITPDLIDRLNKVFAKGSWEAEKS